MRVCPGVIVSVVGAALGLYWHKAGFDSVHAPYAWLSTCASGSAPLLSVYGRFTSAALCALIFTHILIRAFVPAAWLLLSPHDHIFIGPVTAVDWEQHVALHLAMAQHLAVPGSQRSAALTALSSFQRIFTAPGQDTGVLSFDAGQLLYGTCATSLLVPVISVTQAPGSACAQCFQRTPDVLDPPPRSFPTRLFDVKLCS